MKEEKTEFQDPETEEKIINTDKIYDLVYLYKIPLIFLVLAILLLGGAFLLWQSSNPSDKISFSQEASESASANGRIKADIEGEVLKPGVYELTLGSRINELLIMAGGLTVEADREWVNKNLNLAAKVQDGGKIYIPSKNSNLDAKSQNDQKTMAISINSASQIELESLPGIGPVTAQKIIDNRPYQTLEELVSKKAVGQAVFEKIKDKISLY